MLQFYTNDLSSKLLMLALLIWAARSSVADGQQAKGQEWIDVDRDHVANVTTLDSLLKLVRPVNAAEKLTSMHDENSQIPHKAWSAMAYANAGMYADKQDWLNQAKFENEFENLSIGKSARTSRYLVWTYLEAANLQAIGLSIKPERSKVGDAARLLHLSASAPLSSDTKSGSSKEFAETAADLLLFDDGDTRNNLNPGGLGTYTSWGISDAVDPGVIAASMSALQILYDEGLVRDWNLLRIGRGPLSEEAGKKLNRWCDVLLHVIVVLSDPSEQHRDAAIPIDPSQDPDAWVEQYRFLPGRPLLQVRSVKREPRRKWTSTQFKPIKYGAGPSTLYEHTSGLYALIVASHLLEATLQDIQQQTAGSGSTGGYYTIAHSVDDDYNTWSFADRSKKTRGKIILESQSSLGIRVRVDGQRGDPQEALYRLDDEVRFGLAGIYSEHKKLTLVADKTKNFLYQNTLTAYTIMRLFIAAGHPDMICGETWHLNMQSKIREAAANFGDFNGQDNLKRYGWAEFAVPVLTRSYRPIFQRPQ